MKRNTIKALGYAVAGFIVSIISMLGMIFMYFSGKFLPVYVKGTYVVGNQVFRYELYVILFVLTIAAGALSAYGINFLTKKSRKNKRRRWRLLILKLINNIKNFLFILYEKPLYNQKYYDITKIIKSLRKERRIFYGRKFR